MAENNKSYTEENITTFKVNVINKNSHYPIVKASCSDVYHYNQVMLTKQLGSESK